MNEIIKGGYGMQETLTAISYGTSGTVLFLGLSVEHWSIAAAIIGIIGVLGTFAFNAWFKMKYGR